jgi:hypothetical protein
MTEPITSKLINEMLNTEVIVSNKRGTYLTMTLCRVMELYDFDEGEGCLILKKDITDEPYRYYNVNPYMLLNYETVDQEFMEIYGLL